MRKRQDSQDKARILSRIGRLAAGNPGDHRNLKSGVSELRLAAGPGYRVYDTWHGDSLVILLCGGDKLTQPRDIAKAQRLADKIRSD